MRFLRANLLLVTLAILLIAALAGLAYYWNQAQSLASDNSELSSEVHDQSVQIEQLSATPTPSATPIATPTPTPKATITPKATATPRPTATPLK